jgi:hypothetical protein
MFPFALDEPQTRSGATVLVVVWPAAMDKFAVQSKSPFVNQLNRTI